MHKVELEHGYHIGIFYIINNYINEIKENVEVNDINDDSLGASFYETNKLHKDQLSDIALLELNN